MLACLGDATLFAAFRAKNAHGRLERSVVVAPSRRPSTIPPIIPIRPAVVATIIVPTVVTTTPIPIPATTRATLFINPLEGQRKELAAVPLRLLDPAADVVFDAIDFGLSRPVRMGVFLLPVVGEQRAGIVIVSLIGHLSSFIYLTPTVLKALLIVFIDSLPSSPHASAAWNSLLTVADSPTLCERISSPARHADQ